MCVAAPILLFHLPGGGDFNFYARRERRGRNPTFENENIISI